MTANKRGYWAIIALFVCVYLAIMFAGVVGTHGGDYVYTCTTDAECYVECEINGGENCD